MRQPKISEAFFPVFKHQINGVFVAWKHVHPVKSLATRCERGWTKKGKREKEMTDRTRCCKQMRTELWDVRKREFKTALISNDKYTTVRFCFHLVAALLCEWVLLRTLSPKLYDCAHPVGLFLLCCVSSSLIFNPLGFLSFLPFFPSIARITSKFFDRPSFS